MEANITWLTAWLIVVFSCGLDLAGRDHAWRQLRWPWLAIMLGKLLGLRIVAPVSGDAVRSAEKVVLITLLAFLPVFGVRWIYRRYCRRLKLKRAGVLETAH
jgi:hypothetical protein